MLSPVRPSVRLSQGWISRKRLRLTSIMQFSAIFTAVGRHLGFDRNTNGTNRSADPENSLKMVNGTRYYRALESVSIAPALSTAFSFLPFTHARSESINADSLNSNFLQPGRRSGGRPQRTVYPRRLPINTVIHTN